MRTLIMAGAMLMLAACVPGGPESTLHSYLQYLQKQEYEKAYEMTAGSYRNNVPLNLYRAQMQAARLWQDVLATPEETEFDVGTATVDEQRGRAKILVAVTRPDVAAELSRRMEQSVNVLVTGEAAPAAGGERPMLTDMVTYTLVKEKDGWKVMP